MALFGLFIKYKDVSRRIINQNDGADDDEDDDEDEDDDAVSSDDSDAESGPASNKAINADEAASKEASIICFIILLENSINIINTL